MFLDGVGITEYKQRRDFMCSILADRLSAVIDFKIPDGGLAIWSKYDKKINLPGLALKLKEKGIILSNGRVHDSIAGRKLNSTRMVFGWMNLKESEMAVDILYKAIYK